MTLATKTIGQGRDIVLIHGWGADSRIWQAWAKQTFLGYRLTFIDLPGHGNSPELGADDTQIADSWQNALLAVMPENAIVVGWSLGGLLAQRIALTRPERVSALILIATSPCFVQRTGWLSALEASLFSRYLTEVVTQTPSLLNSFTALQTLGSAYPKQLLKQLLALSNAQLACHHQSLKQGLLLLKELDLRAQLIEFLMPTLWLLGEQDAIVPDSLAQSLPSLQPQAQIQVIAQSGHIPFLSQAQMTTQAVHTFLQGIAYD
jgi:pimeloyl-[acyl-carrier protein] methyl ester esterase